MVRLLTLCTGNICRSPFAHLYLQHHLERVSPGNFVVSSAGTYGLEGRAMDERAAAHLAEAGVSAEGFAARRLTESLLTEPDFVLALSDEHRDLAVSMAPRLLKRAFTVREFAAVLDRVEAVDGASVPVGPDAAARWKAVFRLASRHRSAVRKEYDDAGALDVVDPYRREDAVYTEMVDQLLPALERIVAFEAAAAARTV